MRLIYLARLNGSLAALYTLLKESIADAYLIAGDIIDMPFHSPERSRRFRELADFFRSRMGDERASSARLLRYAGDMLREGADHELCGKCEEFISESEKAARVMRAKYAMTGNVISTKPYVPVLLFGGENDLPLAETGLAERDLAARTHAVGGLRVAGFRAGADIEGGPERSAATVHSASPLPHVLVTCEGEATPAGGVLPLIHLAGHCPGFAPPERIGGCVICAAPQFGNICDDGSAIAEGGFFYEIEMDVGSVTRMTLKKIAAERIYDIAEYRFETSPASCRTIDAARFDALMCGAPFDSVRERHVHIPEIQIFRDIRNFFRIHQTEDTERLVEGLARTLEALGGEYDDVALDLVGSTNLGLAQKSSDVDMVLYIDRNNMCLDEDTTCDRFGEIEEKIRKMAAGNYEFEIIDTINLDLVRRGILEEEHDNPSLQRFVAYRAMCRPVNYRVIAPVEDLLAANAGFREEVERGMAEHLRILGTTKDTTRSFDKYQARLKAIGIDIPEALARKINAYLQKGPAAD